MGKKVFIWVIIKAREKVKLQKSEILDIIFLPCKHPPNTPPQFLIKYNLNFNFVLNMA